jgi:uncharacterized protein YjbI with pentapeptide repeats
MYVEWWPTWLSLWRQISAICDSAKIANLQNHKTIFEDQNSPYVSYTGVHLTGVHLTGVHLTGMHLTGVHLTGMHLTGMHLMSMCLIGVIGVYLTL